MKKLLILLSLSFFQTHAMAHTATELFEAVKNNDKREINIALSQCYCPSDDGDGIHCEYDSDGRCECRNGNGDTFYPHEKSGKMTGPDKNKADASVLDEQGRTILHVAATYGHTEIVKMILRHGVDIDTGDDLGNTPLHYAAQYGQVKMAGILIEEGASQSIKNDAQETPLAVALKHMHHEIIALLTPHQASVDYITDADGISTYVGKCLLHDDYENIEYLAIEIIPYTPYPTKRFLESLDSPLKELATELLKKEAQLVGEDFRSLYDTYLDDISFDYIDFPKWNHDGTLYRVGYGVGGGNGGFMTFSVSPGGEITLLARTFDGDVVECDEKIMGTKPESNSVLDVIL